jgi:hypothetical protein
MYTETHVLVYNCTVPYARVHVLHAHCVAYAVLSMFAREAAGELTCFADVTQVPRRQLRHLLICVFLSCQASCV